MYIVVIDIGKQHHETSIIDGQGIVRGKSLHLTNSHTGFNRTVKKRW